MKTIPRKDWLNELRFGDIVMVHGKTFFGKLQDINDRIERDALSATHSFIMKSPPWISEADGKIVNGHNQIMRYFTNHHQMWVFRYGMLSDAQRENIGSFITGAERTRGTYSWGGIMEFFRRGYMQLLGFKYIPKDRAGVFCSEYTSEIINNAEIPYMTEKPHLISPSRQLSWFMHNGIISYGWEFVLYYENGHEFAT